MLRAHLLLGSTPDYDRAARQGGSAAMPYADSAETVRSWAEDRAIAVWTLFAGDLPTTTQAALAIDLEHVRLDGAVVVLVVPDDVPPTPLERRLADIVVRGPLPPSPFGLLVALAAANIPDVRRLGLIGGSRESLIAGQCAGAGAVVGIAGHGHSSRLDLLRGQPDRIVEPADFAATDAFLYGRTRHHRERVLLNPGPAVVSVRIHRAVAGPDLCHREPEYSEMFIRIREKLFRVAGVNDDWELALIAGSGTAAMEAMTGAAVRAALDADPTIDALAVVHHETTTGLLNPVHEIAAEARARGVRAIVDAIRSLGAEEL